MKNNQGIEIGEPGGIDRADRDPGPPEGSWCPECGERFIREENAVHRYQDEFHRPWCLECAPRCTSCREPQPLDQYDLTGVCRTCREDE